MKSNKSNISPWELIVRIGIVVALIVGIIEIIQFLDSRKDTPDITNTADNGGEATINIAETINIQNPKENIVPKAVFNDVSLDYINQHDDRISEHLYPMNFDDLSEYESEYSVTDNCFTSLLVSNNSEHEYEITRFSFYASEIEKDYAPYFEGNLEDDGYGVLTLNLHNDGWGEANNVRIELSDEDDILPEYFAMDDLSWNVDKFLPNEDKKIQLLTNDDLLKCPNDNEVIRCVFTIVSDENIFVLKEPLVFWITPEGMISIGGGAPSIMAYGIYIDTDESEFSFSKNVSEIIKPNSNIDLPICFFPNMSCSMTFYIELEIFDGEKYITVKTAEKDMYFRVSHAAECMDGSNVDNNYEENTDDIFVSYPFIEG